MPDSTPPPAVGLHAAVAPDGSTPPASAPRGGRRRRAGAAPRIPSLDGLRALSISLVLLDHASRTAGFPTPGLQHFELGTLGVRVFFVISGFLITGLLLREREETGRIHLRGFYLRRVFRIFPAYYAYLAALAVAAAVGVVPAVQPQAWREAFTYTVNYSRLTSFPTTAHFWSLAIEEQFYVLWPPLLAWLGARRGTRAVAAFAVVAPLLRAAVYATHGESLYIVRGFEVVGDAIAAGCLLALCRDALWTRGWYRRLLKSWWIALVALVSVAAHQTQNHPLFYFGAGITATNLGVALLLDAAVRAPAGRVSALVHRALNMRPVVFVGTLSYSLYIWQQPFFDYNQSAPWQHFPQNLVLAVLAALASYYAIERPMLRLRSRLERRRVLRAESATVDALDAAAAP